MKDAINFLEGKELRFIRPTTHQLKIGPINYYPGSGTIQLDGKPRSQDRGLSGLDRTIQSLRDALEDFKQMRSMSSALEEDKSL